MTTETFLEIKKILDDAQVEYTHLTHEYVRTSEDAAKIRGTKIEDAAKAIILKAEHKENSDNTSDNTSDNISDNKTSYFIQAVIPANERIDLKKLKILLGSRNISLASPEEVLQRTGCTVGSVPPFGKLFNISMYIDESLLQKDIIVFSAGTHNDSIQMKVSDYLTILEPKVAEFKKIY